MTFEQLCIHQDTIQRLEKSVSESRIPHAQYIQTVDGGGGLPIAVAYAQSILSPQADMFGGVDTRASRLEHPDLHVVFPMVQSVDKTCDSLMGVFREYYAENPYTSYEQWLRFRGEKNKKAIISKHEAESVTKKLSLRSFEAGHKVLLIWMAELMNADCANKLLKLIEEPPEGSVILMVGNDSDRLLPTIRSRTQVLKLRPLENNEIQASLRKSVQATDDELASAVVDCEGSIARAIELLDVDESPAADQVMTWLRLCYQRKVLDTMSWSDGLAAQGREEALMVLKAALDVFREAFRKNYLTVSSNSNADLGRFTDKFSPFIHPGNAPQLMEETSIAIRDIERNGNVRIVLLDLSFKVMKLIRAPRPEAEKIN
jgi:DNA polymerase-3 subunit delta'